MNITINGNPQTINEQQTVLELLKSFKLNPDTTAVEKNGVILQKGSYASETISDNDIFELIRFMGGG
ncbi:sulfur carrier protein ThiS [Candidatus Margulisiibacteriota bacterium]